MIWQGARCEALGARKNGCIMVKRNSTSHVTLEINKTKSRLTSIENIRDTPDGEIFRLHFEADEIDVNSLIKIVDEMKLSPINRDILIETIVKSANRMAVVDLLTR